MKEIKIIQLGDKAYPKKLLKIKNPPKQLYVLGDETLLNKKSIAMIGSRNCTPYGYDQAQRFAKELSKHSVCIISGMAEGIDSASHIGAKGEIGKTVAVLGGGFYDIFPKENEGLFYEILEQGGCIVSEYAPEIKHKSSYFPERNRIVSGLSDGVLVIEARHRSGTSITARLAQEQGKKVYCIPMNLGETTGVGTARLIQNGAKLVISPNDILRDMGIVCNDDVELEEKEIKVEEQYQPVYNVLRKMPLSANEIARRSGKSVVEVNSILTILELQGLIREVGMNEFVKS